METIEKNMLEITSGILCHQVNCMGIMGAGIALQIAKKYPEVKDTYVEFCETNHIEKLVGRCLFVRVADDLWIANLFGQVECSGRKQETDYGYLAMAMQEVAKNVDRLGVKVYIPYGMGCGLGGGDWSKVEKLIEVFLPEAIICKLPG